MSGIEGEYDVIASLGANCMAAHNFQERGLRTCAFPFDWCYIVDEMPIKWLADNLSKNFQDLCLKTNLIEITPSHPEWSNAHKERIQYVDNISGYRFVNHFSKSKDNDEEYLHVYTMLRRRVKRFVQMIGSAKRVLLVLATSVQISKDTFLALRSAFEQRFPTVDFDFVYMKFCADGSEKGVEAAGVHVLSIERCQNKYDFERTNFEWSWLDRINISCSRCRKKDKNVLFHGSFDVWPGCRLHLTLKRKKV